MIHTRRGESTARLPKHPMTSAASTVFDVSDLSSLGAASAGVWTRREALLLVSERQIRTYVHDGSWQVVLPGIYADGGCALDAEQRAVAAVLSSGGHTGQPQLQQDRGSWRAAACGRTAARVWALPLIDDDDPSTGAAEHLIDEVAVRVSRRALALPDGRTVRRLRPSLDPADVTRRASGLLLTTLNRTLLDCCATLSPQAAVCLLDAALHRGLVGQRALATVLETHRWKRGAPALRAALRSADERAESPHESLVRLLLKPHLPRLTPQVRLYDGQRVIARFDLADERARFAVEADGRTGHAGELMVAKDRRRDEQARRLGWHTERVTWFEVRREPDRVVRRVVAAYARHAGAAAA
jgi:very-short-patch-repair endonuclease